MSNTSILRQLIAAYPNAKATIETIAVYDRHLSDIPDDELQVVIDQSIAECKFLPTVSELRDRWHSLTTTCGQLAASDAWGMVKREIRRIGSWGTPTFDDPLIARVVANMGWLELCQSESPEGVDRAQFERAYNALSERSVKEQKLLPAARELTRRNGGSLTHIGALLPKLKQVEHN
jgi:hypothetical protein